jgi:hypothetical protein
LIDLLKDPRPAYYAASLQTIRFGDHIRAMRVETGLTPVSPAEKFGLPREVAALAEMQNEMHQQLMALTPTASAELEALWQATAQNAAADEPAVSLDARELLPAQYFVLIPCRDEGQQVELLRRFQGEGLECRALLS